MDIDDGAYLNASYAQVISECHSGGQNTAYGLPWMVSAKSLHSLLVQCVLARCLQLNAATWAH
ncbi:hypothetical protein SAMN05660380_00842 [Xylella fastidiosa]|jgi:hypothetical protein|nr:hypothetical protein SAMN05660380_00842 [Xylella fastidiosa]